MPLSPEAVEKLTLAIDQIVPADDWPSASQAGVLSFLLDLIESENLTETYEAGLREPNPGFQELLATQTIEGYYGRAGAGWDMVGFEVTA